MMNNKIGDEGGKALGKALEMNSKSVLRSDLLLTLDLFLIGGLTVLYFYSNQIGDVGASALAEALKVNTALQDLVGTTEYAGDASWFKGY